jgi:hypothetical protein
MAVQEPERLFKLQDLNAAIVNFLSIFCQFSVNLIDSCRMSGFVRPGSSPMTRFDFVRAAVRLRRTKNLSENRHGVFFGKCSNIVDVFSAHGSEMVRHVYGTVHRGADSHVSPQPRMDKTLSLE